MGRQDKRGQLSFKGDEPIKKKTKNKNSSSIKHHHTNTSSNQDDNQQQAQQQSTAAAAAAAPPPPPTPALVNTTPNTATISTATTNMIRTGTGTITTSGTVVTGYKTLFENEINVGDAIIVTSPTINTNSSDNNTKNNTTTTEMRIVTMRLSNISINLSSSFSNNYSTPISFQYISKPKNTTKSKNDILYQQYKEQDEINRHAFDTYHHNSSAGTETTGNNNTEQVVVYRERTAHGSYRIKTTNATTGTTSATTSDSAVSSSLTRTDLLNFRSKKTSDKYC